ncbi:MAG: MFS transporter, partial [Alphaproteobacteria bacterium]|nr:MFS transporter [Alphaproteobacteria bacterium]
FTFILVGAAFWGMQMGINQSLLTATISSTSSEANRGTAFGIYYITAGSAIFLANAIVGNLAKLYGLQNAFFYSSGMAILAILCLPMLKKR